MTYKIKYRSEDEMKDSGIEWLGKVPNEWTLSKLKFVINEFITGGTPDSTNYNYYTEFDEGVPWVSISDMSNKSIVNETKSSVTRLGRRSKNLRVLSKGTLIYSIFATLGKVSELNIDATTNQAILGLINNKFLVYNQYLKYWLINIEKDLKYYSSANTQENLNTNKVKNLNFLYPNNIEVQQKIANFLDLKTSEFDSIISKKELLIEKLEEATKSLISEAVTGKVKIVDGELVEREPHEMQDSGVQWLGMIPKDWEVKRLKHYTSKTGSGKTPRGGSEVYLEEGIPFLRSQNIYNDGLRLDDVVFISDKINDEMINSIVTKGDILLNITGASIGRCCLYNLEKNANVNQHVCIIRLRNKSTYGKLIELLLQSNVVQDYINSFQTGSSREGLNFEQIKNIVIPISKDNNDILNLATKIDNKVNQINSIITKTKLQIQKLKQAKQSLISECVTGKIDLRDWEIQEI